jgi:hypothetical protein
MQTENIINATLLNIVAALLIFFAGIFLLSEAETSREYSMFVTYISAFFSLTYILVFMYVSKQISYIYISLALSIFTFKCLIGVLHYLVFMDGEYFATGAFSYLNDHEWLLTSSTRTASHWQEFGITSIPIDFQADKNTFLIPYFSLVFYLGDNYHFLNFTILNSLHNMLTAVLVASFSTLYVGRQTAQVIFIIALIQPFGLFSSILWRDSVGQTFLVMGVIMIMQYAVNKKNFNLAFLGVFLMALLRNIYLFAGILSLFYFSLRSKKKTLILKFVNILTVLTLVSFFYIYFYDPIMNLYDFSGKSVAYNLDALGFLRKIIIAFLGPFPWLQIFNPEIPGREYMLADIFQATYNLAIMFLLAVHLINTKTKFRSYLNQTALGMIIIISMLGVLSYGHVSYVTVGSVLLLPILNTISLRKFLKVWFSIITINFTLSIIWYAI